MSSDLFIIWSDFVSGNRPSSLLTPGQFNSILYGGCSQKNKIFNECSQLAYQSSVKNPDCIEKRNQCESQNIHGLDKQEEIERLKKRIETKRGILVDFLNERADFVKSARKSSNLPSFNYMKAARRLLKPQPANRISQDDSHQKELAPLNFQIELQKQNRALDDLNLDDLQQKKLHYLDSYIDSYNKTLDDLKRRLKGVKSWPNP